ncbi:GNAT family N-acetyltransferase [Salipiger sp.]|uniref:GNAT family N-acetyltransferase n=1 Tax=Salipiger sp. TaxID=2078585 RepID=UPI003A96F9E0
MTDVELAPYTAADRDWLVGRHRALYARDEGFDESFPALVEEILIAFEAEHDAHRERGWIAREDGARLGSIFCVRLDDETAKLRLFLLEPEARGKRLGQRMLDTCMAFARAAGYRRIVLWTHESHRAACALYARNGFDLLRSEAKVSFGRAVVEQHWDRAL